MFDEALLQAAGPLRAAYAAVDWAASPLGPPDRWSPALRSAAMMTLHTRFPITLLWGPEFALVYNGAYVPVIGDKHPSALGRPAAEVFPEAWDQIGPTMRAVRSGEGATYVENAAVPLDRSGFLEECYFTFSYSPMHGEDGTIEGVMDIVTETTRQVLDRRRLFTLSRLSEHLGDLQHVDEVPRRVLPLLREHTEDLVAVDIRVAGGSSAPGDDRLPAAPRQPLGDRGSHLEETPHGRVAWFPLAPRAPVAPAESQPVLVVLLSDRLAADAEYVGFLSLIAASLSQALDRVSARESERGMSEALQRSLLTQPLEPDHLEIAVRYLPATQQAQIGGDWYDSFMLPDGSLTLVIGDVAGHDQGAAAAMAQVRNLLRGVSYTLQKPPAVVLTGLDGAMHGLAVDVFATAIVAQIEQTAADSQVGRRTLRWSNAGHPAPVLLRPDGTAELLESPPDLMLGLASDRRDDHTIEIEAGAVVLLYTDGLVERRGVSMQERWNWLLGVVAGQQHLTAEELCDHVLEELDDGVDDDVALLALRAYPDRGPRPAEAGPEVLPGDLREDTGLVVD